MLTCQTNMMNIAHILLAHRAASIAVDSNAGSKLAGAVFSPPKLPGALY